MKRAMPRDRIRQVSERTRLLIVTAFLLLTPLQATELYEQRLTAALQQALTRLDLSEEQSAQLLPILESHFEAQMALLAQFESESKMGTERLENAQELARQLQSNNQRLEAELAEFLSHAQMSEFRRLQEEGTEAIREQMFASGMQVLAETLGLSDTQLSAAEPILSGHLQSQLAIFDKHGIDLSGTKKAGMRTLLALRRDTGAVNARTLEQLSEILSEDQLAQYEAMQKAQSKRIGEHLR